MTRNVANTNGPATANCEPTNAAASNGRKRKPLPVMLSPVCFRVTKSLAKFQ